MVGLAIPHFKLLEAFGLGRLCSYPIIGLPCADVQKRPFGKAAVRLEWAVALDRLCHRAKYPLREFSYFAQKRKPHLRRLRRRTVNKDQVFGKVEQAVGKVKQSVGETLGNEKLANQGVVDQAKGAAKETWGNAKDAAKEVRQSRQDVATDKAHERRNKISQSVQDAKDKASEKIDQLKERHSA
jgi:uncharacterized protein YjbJ (UPF0337 family)